MVTAIRPSRQTIEEEFYTPLPVGQGRHIQHRVNGEDAEGSLETLGYLLRWEACYFVAGPDFAYSEQELLHAVTQGRVEQLNRGEAEAAQVHRYCSLIEAVAGLCSLIGQSYGPEGEAHLEDEQWPEEYLLDAGASPEDPSYCQF